MIYLLLYVFGGGEYMWLSFILWIQYIHYNPCPTLKQRIEYKLQSKEIYFYNSDPMTLKTQLKFEKKCIKRKIQKVINFTPQKNAILWLTRTHSVKISTNTSLQCAVSSCRRWYWSKWMQASCKNGLNIMPVIIKYYWL